MTILGSSVTHARTVGVACAAALALAMASGCTGSSDGAGGLSGEAPGGSVVHGEPDDGGGDLLAWAGGVDALCGQAIQDYRDFDTRDPDPVSAAVAASNLVGQVADAAETTVPTDPVADRLVQALRAYSEAEAGVAVAMDGGSSQAVSTANDTWNAATSELQQAASDLAASSCVDVTQEM